MVSPIQHIPPIQYLQIRLKSLSDKISSADDKECLGEFIKRIAKPEEQDAITSFKVTQKAIITNLESLKKNLENDSDIPDNVFTARIIIANGDHYFPFKSMIVIYKSWSNFAIDFFRKKSVQLGK